MPLPEYYVGLLGRPPPVAQLSALLSAYGYVKGDWKTGIEIGGVRVEIPADSALLREALARVSALPIEAALVIPRGPRSTLVDVARALLRLCGGAFVDDRGDVLEQAPAGAEVPKEPPAKLTNTTLNIAVPMEVQVGFGRAQSLYALAARAAPTATFALISSPIFPSQKLGYAPLGDWERNSIGSLALRAVNDRDYPLYQKELDAIGLQRPAALFRLEFERWYQTSAPPEEWQAMLQLLCGLARETGGILYQPPGEVWCDFGVDPYKVRASEVLRREIATPKMLESAALDDGGTGRPHNEDRAAVFPELGLCVVADGMGPASTGDEAADLVLSTLGACLRQQTHGPPVCGPSWENHRLVEAIRLASVRITAVSHSFDRDQPSIYGRGLGAAAAAALAVEGGVLIAHVGNCRAYRLRDGALTALTTDHTLLEEKRAELPEDTPPEAWSLFKNVLTRALGQMNTPKADARFEALLPGDLFLLCTDGLHSVLSEAEIAERLLRGQPLSVTCQELIHDANLRGTPDNLALTLARWE